MTNIFISYRREDASDATGRIKDRLRERYGKEAIFTDVDSIPLGMDFRKVLDEKVGKCKVLLAVMGKDWLSAENRDGTQRIFEPDDFVRFEIQTALERDILVIPLLVQGIKMPVVEELPDSLSELAFRNAVAIRPDPDFHNDIDRLINELDSHFEDKRITESVSKVEKKKAVATVTGKHDDVDNSIRPKAIGGFPVYKVAIALAAVLFLATSAVLYMFVSKKPDDTNANLKQETSSKSLLPYRETPESATRAAADPVADQLPVADDSPGEGTAENSYKSGNTIRPFSSEKRGGSARKPKTRVDVTLPDGTKTSINVSGDNSTTVTIKPTGEILLNTCPPGRICADPDTLMYPESAYLKIAGKVIVGTRTGGDMSRSFEFAAVPCGKRAEATFIYVQQARGVVKSLRDTMFVSCADRVLNLDFPESIDIEKFDPYIPPTITSVELSTEIVKKSCAPGFRPKEKEVCDDDQTVLIRTTAANKHNDVLTYNYGVNGGRIVGNGASLVWDLTGVGPGEYTVTVSADAGLGPGRTLSRRVRVVECDCVGEGN